MLVLLCTHVAIAVSSVAVATGLLIAPVATRFKAAYSLIAATLISGTALVVASRSNLVSACESGIAYLVLVSSVLAFARFRLVRQEQEK